VKKKFTVRADVTISLHAEVYAADEAAALELAESLYMPLIHENPPYRREGISDEHWNTSGEFDGEPKNLTAELDDE
jgi:hypothetical protein